MLRIFRTAVPAAVIVMTATLAHAEYMGSRAEVPLAPSIDPLVTDSVISIGATTTMNEHDAVVTAPGRGKIVATANADVFCAGEETARSVIVDVPQEGDVMLDFCEAHLDRRDVVIRFLPAPP